MPKHTSSPQRVMLTTITELIKQAKACGIGDEWPPCPLMHKLMEAKHSLQIEVKNLGENDREVKP